MSPTLTWHSSPPSSSGYCLVVLTHVPPPLTSHAIHPLRRLAVSCTRPTMPPRGPSRSLHGYASRKRKGEDRPMAAPTCYRRGGLAGLTLKVDPEPSSSSGGARLRSHAKEEIHIVSHHVRHGGHSPLRSSKRSSSQYRGR
jgi:hypothetical protein